MQLRPWPDELETTLWAKSATGSQPPESLPRHTALVLKRLADFMRLRPGLPQHVGQPRLWHILYWAAFLHDFGKAMPGFQTTLRPNGDPNLKAQWQGQRHEVFSLAFLGWITAGLDETEKLLAAAAIVSHHKDAPDIQEAYNRSEQERLGDHIAGLPDAHLRGLHQWLRDAGWAWAQQLGLAELGVAPVALVAEPVTPFGETAVSTIRHWLKAYRKFFRQLQRQQNGAELIPLLALRGTLINADHSASAHAPRLHPLHLTADQVLASRGLRRDQLHTHQTAAETVIGSALLIAPTGSGKTEAALLWAAAQQTAVALPPRLFYTLPYQASMNAMQTRLSQTFGGQNVGLQHGRALLALYRQLMERAENSDPHTTARQARWLQDLSRLNHPPVRVFSPYQMLKAMYRLKGYEAQLTDYHNALFIFDEIHAYEVRRLALILKTIEYLRRHYHARFFIMSATFPRLIKNWLADALGTAVTLQATPALFAQFQRHRLHLIEGELLQNLALVEQDARAGKSVLVTCNLVDNAQQAYEELAERLDGTDVELLLLHGRFHLRDRLQKEQRVQTCTGVTSQTPKPVVLVATQVVEVSLDIDLDTIYTEPAPMEVLVQRFGRVNRARQKGLAPVHIFTQPQDGQHIYDPRLITGTLAILQQQDGRPLDESAIGPWLDQIYDGDIARDWQKIYDQTAAEFETIVINALRPFASADYDFQERFNKLFDGLDVLPADLHNDYYDLAEDGRFIEARQLLVPISWARFHIMRNAGKIRRDDDLRQQIIYAPYTSEKGLQFDDD